MCIYILFLKIVFKIMCLHSSVMLSQLCCKYYTWKEEENTPSNPKPEAILKCEKNSHHKKSNITSLSPMWWKEIVFILIKVPHLTMVLGIYIYNIHFFEIWRKSPNTVTNSRISRQIVNFIYSYTYETAVETFDN